MTESGKKNGTILAFLRARLDEDEETATAALAHRPRFLRLRVWLRRLRWGSS